MNKSLWIFIGLILLSSMTLSAQRFVKKTFHSNALGVDKTYYISLPDGYDEADTTKKFPVIIFLHGASVNADQMVMPLELVLPYSQSIYKNLFKVIFVIPDGSSAPFLGSFYTNSELYGNFEDYIAVDLRNEIKTKYNTYTNRKKWSIMGHSMGGYGSMKCALKNQEHYIGIASLSGPLHVTYYQDMLPRILTENGDSPPYNFTYTSSLTKLIYSMAGAFSPNLSNDPPVDFPITSEGIIDQDIAGRWEINNPINMIKNWNHDLEMAVYMYCGELDGYKLLSQNQLFSDTLTKYQIPHTFKIDPEGDHTQSLASSLPLGINFLYNVMDTSKIDTSSSFVRNNSINNDYIFPNPASDIIYFKTNGIDEINKVVVYSFTGEKILETGGNGIAHGLNISQLNSGLNLVKITYDSGEEKQFKFMKSPSDQ